MSWTWIAGYMLGADFSCICVFVVFVHLCICCICAGPELQGVLVWELGSGFCSVFQARGLLPPPFSTKYRHHQTLNISAIFAFVWSKSFFFSDRVCCFQIWIQIFCWIAIQPNVSNSFWLWMFSIVFLIANSVKNCFLLGNSKKKPPKCYILLQQQYDMSDINRNYLESFPSSPPSFCSIINTAPARGEPPPTPTHPLSTPLSLLFIREIF